MKRLIMGKHCIAEVLKSAPKRLQIVYTTQRDDPLLTLLAKHKIPLKIVSKGELAAMVQSDSHQGFVAAVSEKGSRTLNEFLESADAKAVIALDNINDPHNLGSILRAAECFGVDAVTFSKNRGADITPVVSKTSVGGSELVEVLKVSNLAETVKKFKECDFTIIAADLSDEAVSLYEFQFPEKFLLVMGSEGVGIQKLIMRYVDQQVYIPMCGNIDSLNVSQATAVFLSNWRCRGFP
jgi:23S rRNA (guanosine2251-2'-O)-methyltransferase